MPVFRVQNRPIIPRFPLKCRSSKPESGKKGMLFPMPPEKQHGPDRTRAADPWLIEKKKMRKFSRILVPFLEGSLVKEILVALVLGIAVALIARITYISIGIVLS